MKNTKRILYAGVLLALLLLIGCGGHDINSLKSTLLGHWVNESGKTHYYFSSTSLVMVDKGRRMDQNYTVLELNEDENWIKIRVKTGYEKGHDKLLEIARNRKSLTQTIEIEIFGISVSSSNRWNYVDSKQSP